MLKVGYKGETTSIPSLNPSFPPSSLSAGLEFRLLFKFPSARIVVSISSSSCPPKSTLGQSAHRVLVMSFPARFSLGLRLWEESRTNRGVFIIVAT